LASSTDRPDIGPSAADGVAAAGRILASMVPVAGPFLTELITEIVPGQRQERFEDFLRQLHARLGMVEETLLNKRLRRPENVALFEEGAYQAARAISEERRQKIAELVAGGIADDRRDYIESHRVLRLLGELDDAEVIILAGYLQKHREGEYWKRHANVVEDVGANLQSSRDELDADTVRKAGRQHLVQLGLLDQGAIGGSASISLNGLGRLLLRRIGLANDDDW